MRLHQTILKAAISILLSSSLSMGMNRESCLTRFVSLVSGVFQTRPLNNTGTSLIKWLRKKRYSAASRGDEVAENRYSQELAEELLKGVDPTDQDLIEMGELFEKGRLTGSIKDRIEKKLREVIRNGVSFRDVLSETKTLEKWEVFLGESGKRDNLLTAFLNGNELPPTEVSLKEVKLNFTRRVLSNKDATLEEKLLAARFLARFPEWESSGAMKGLIQSQTIEGVALSELIQTIRLLDSPLDKRWEKMVAIKFQCIIGEMVSVFLSSEFSDRVKAIRADKAFLISNGGSMRDRGGSFGKPPTSDVVHALIAEGNDYVFQVNSNIGIFQIYTEKWQELNSPKKHSIVLASLAKDSLEHSRELVEQIKGGSFKLADYVDGWRFLPNPADYGERMDHLLDYVTLQELKKGNRLILE